MTNRASTLLDARRERLERILDRHLERRDTGSVEPLDAEAREYLTEEAESLYWNDLEWEHITDEEALDEGPITQLAFPGFLAFVRGLLLREAMPDSKAPANPRPQVVDDILAFLSQRVVELEDGLAGSDDPDSERMRTELEMTSQLIDLVMYLLHDVSEEDIETIEAAGRASD